MTQTKTTEDLTRTLREEKARLEALIKDIEDCSIERGQAYVILIRITKTLGTYAYLIQENFFRSTK